MGGSGTGVGRHSAMASTGPGVTTGNKAANTGATGTAGASGANANTNTGTAGTAGTGAENVCSLALFPPKKSSNFLSGVQRA